MSVPTQKQAAAFLTPLRGRLAMVLLHDLQTRVALSRFVLACADLQSIETTVLDVDAFYSTNMVMLAEHARTLRGGVTLLPGSEFDPGSLLPLLSSKGGMLVVDDLNSLNSLSSDGQRLHELMVVLKFLALNARSNGSWMIATAYRTKTPAEGEPESQRPWASVYDVVVDATLEGGSLVLRSRSLWTEGVLEV
jgi:hypothetical protein